MDQSDVDLNVGRWTGTAAATPSLFRSTFQVLVCFVLHQSQWLVVMFGSEAVCSDAICVICYWLMQ